MTNVNCMHRYSTGQPLPSPGGDESRTRDDRDAAHLANLDVLVDQRLQRVNAQNRAPDGTESTANHARTECAATDATATTDSHHGY